MASVIVSGLYQTRTDSAVCIVQGWEDFWFPLSQIEDAPDFGDLRRGDDVEIEVPEWLAEDKGVDYDYC